ncbi:MAG: cupin domain-containing protein [Pirellulales bacterium]|nr:cupin domain-containing protein [Pirellulales bacterium]
MNLLAGIPTSIPDEVTDVLLTADHLRIERIVSHGQASPEGFWYDQPQHEWVLVLRGAARLEFEHDTRELCAGDCVNIPAHVRHRVAWTTRDEPTIWLAIFYG